MHSTRYLKKAKMRVAARKRRVAGVGVGGWGGRGVGVGRVGELGSEELESGELGQESWGPRL